MKRIFLAFLLGFLLISAAAEPVITLPFDDGGDTAAPGQQVHGALGKKSGSRTISSLLVEGIVSRAFASGRDAGGKLHTIYYFPVPGLKGSENAVSLWIKPADWQGGDREQHVFFSAMGGGGAQRLLIYRIGYDSRMQVFLGPLNAPKQATVAFQSAKSWKTGEWHQLTVTWNTAELKLFIDGKPVAAKPIVTPIKEDFSTFAIGENFGGNPGCTLIDEVRIFNAHLSDEEAAAEFTRIKTK